MTKLLPYGCIKKMETIKSLLEFNKILDCLLYEDTIGHLFIVDIKFHNRNPKTMLSNEKKRREETINICTNLLYDNEDVIEGINKVEFKNLLSLATQESYFIYNDVL